MKNLIAYILILFFSTVTFAQTPKELIPTRIRPSDLLGRSIDSDDNYYVMGAPYNSEVGESAGAVFIFGRGVGEEWVLVKEVFSPDVTTDFNFGYFLALDNGRLLVTGVGKSYLFSKDQGGVDNWGQIKEFTTGSIYSGIDLEGDLAVIGTSVFSKDQGGTDQWGLVTNLTKGGQGYEIDGNYIFQGNQSANSLAGEVNIYGKDIGGTDNWGLFKILTPASLSAGDRFGWYSITVENGYLAVGAYQQNKGKVYIFHKDQGGVDNWGLVKEIPGTAYNYFGINVILKNGYLFAAEQDYGTNPRAWQIRVYENGVSTTDWNLVSTIDTPMNHSGGWYPFSIDNNLNISVGAYGNSEFGYYAGLGHYYEPNVGLDTWLKTQDVFPFLTYTAYSGYGYGFAVSIDNDWAVAHFRSFYDGAAFIFNRYQGGDNFWGNVQTIDNFDFVDEAIVSGDNMFISDGNGLGFVNVYDLNGATNQWELTIKLDGATYITSGDFGYTLAYENNTLFATNRNGINSEIFIFEKDRGGTDNWGLLTSITQFDAQSGDEFGDALGVSNDILAVAVPLDDIIGIDEAGSVYLYGRNQGGTDNWGFIKKISGDSQSKRFGNNVAVSDDIIAVTRSNDNKAYIFEKDLGGVDNWGLRKEYNTWSGYGDGLSIENNTVVFGYNNRCCGAGSVHAVNRNEGGPDNWGEFYTYTYTESGSYFGWDVDVFENEIVVGAPQDESGAYEGKAFYLQTNPVSPNISGISSITTNSFTVDWTGELADSYLFDLATDDQFINTVTPYQDYSTSSISINVTGLATGIVYYARVKGVNPEGESSYSLTLNTITLPPAPINLVASDVNKEDFMVTWDPGTGADSYLMDVSIANDFSSFVSGYQNKPISTLPTFISGLVNNTEYFVRVRSKNASGNSVYSQAFSVTTAPSDPVATSATLTGQNQFTANWFSVTGTQYYLLDVSLDLFNTFVSGYNNKTVSGTEVNVVGLNSGIEYSYRVRASNGAGNSDYSNTINQLTISGDPVLNMPTNVTQTGFTISWPAVTGATKYLLDVSDDNFVSFLTGLQGFQIIGTSYPVTGIATGGTFQVRLRSENATGISSYSTTVEQLLLPDDPFAKAATQSTSTGFTANWNPASGATSYLLDVSDTEFSSFVPGYEALEVTGISFEVTGLNGGSTYKYRLRGSNSTGTSDYSNEVSQTTAPLAPVATIATGVTSSSFTANWDPVTGVINYELDVSADNFATYLTGLQSKSVVTTNELIIGLNGGIEYQYRVRAVNSGGTTSNSNTINVTTVPSVPVAIAASSVSQTSFISNWEPVNGASSYLLDVSSDNFASLLTNYDSKSVSTTSDLVSVLSEGIEYQYRVRATNATGTTPNSNFISQITIPGDPVLNLPTNITQTSYTLSWPSVTGAAKYYLDVSEDNFANFITGFQGLQIIETSYQVTGLSPGRIYQSRLRSENSAGISSYSTTVEQLLLPDDPFANAATQSTSTGFTANWNPASGATSYLLDISDTEFSSFIPGYEALEVTGISYEVTSLNGGSTYKYRLRGSNSTGTSDYSNEVSQTTAPLAPVATIATGVTSSSFTANWDPVSGVINYELDVSTDNFATYLAGLQSKSVVTTNVLITGLSGGIEYQYRVRAVNSGGTTSNSSTINVTTVPSVPVAIAASSVSQTSFICNWDPVNGASSYLLDVSSDNFASLLTNYDSKSVSTTSDLVSGLSEGIEYQYRVRATNTSGTSFNSNVITQITIPDTPTALDATNLTSSSFQTNWEEVTGANNYYLDISLDNFSTFLEGLENKMVTGSSEVVTVVGGQTYQYRVRSSNSAGTSPNSEIISVITVPGNPVAQEAADVLNTSFKAVWLEVLGASGYEMDVSIDDFVTFLPGFDSNSISGALEEVVPDLAPETIYKYRVRALNSAGTSGNSNVISVTTLANVASSPLDLVTELFETTQLSSNPQTLNFSVTGGNSPYNVVLSHRKILDADFTGAILPELTPGNFSFEITPAMLDKLGVEFKVEVIDGAANRDSATGMIYVSYNDTESQSILSLEKEGGTDNSWNLFSIPYDLVNRSVSSIFADYAQDRHEFDWRIVRYRGGDNNDYVNYNTGQLKLGEGYWFNTKKLTAVKSGAGQVTNVPFDLPLSLGWNLIGNPYPIPISWDQVLLNNPNVTGVDQLQEFNGRTQTTGNVVNPFSGGFVFADPATTIEIDPRTANIGGRIASTKKMIESEDIDWQEWLLDLYMRTGNEEEKLGGFGMHPEASELKDKFDRMSTPRFFSYTDLSTEHQDYFYPWFATDVVPTTSSYTWSFTLSSNNIDVMSNLVWNKSLLENKESSLYLLDKSSGKLLDMKSQNNYSVDLRNGDFKFDIFFVSNGELFMPSELLLGNAYPNPANTKATIPVIIPTTLGKTKLSLSIYDINGKHINTLSDGIYAPGFYEFTWQMSDSNGQSVNGVFIYRLLFKNSDIAPIQKKLIVR